MPENELYAKLLGEIQSEKKGNASPNQMVHCFGPLNLCPYQIDFGTAYLFQKLKLSTPEMFYEIRDLLFKKASNGISDENFAARASEIHSNFCQCYSVLDKACDNKICKYNLESKIDECFIDDLCFFVWHFGNNDWKRIARHMYNKRDSEFIATYIKNIYVN